MTRAICPVCGKASYSRTGTHPQCAVAHADAISRAARKAAEPKSDKSPARKSWSKTCPKCNCQIPARRFACECGHQFGPVPAGADKQATHKRPEPNGKKPH
jgi:hypothetical protein